MAFDSSKFSCVSCGASVSFRAGASVFAVCKYCNTSLLRAGANLEALGKVAELLDDASIIQIGTVGRIDKGPFSTIGRIRLTWQQGYWDEFYILFDTGAAGWLAHFQGKFAISFETKNYSIPALNEIDVGNLLLVDEVEHLVTDIKLATCTYSEGELPFSGAVGEKYKVIDCAAKSGSAFASISEVEENLAVFSGEYYSFDELNFEHLRVIDGW